VLPAVVALVVSSDVSPPTVVPGTMVTSSGLVLTSRRAIADAIDKSATIWVVRGTGRGALTGRESIRSPTRSQAVPARLLAISEDLDLALVEAMPPEPLFYPHLPVSRRSAAGGAAVLAVGHGAGRGLWSGALGVLGPPHAATGTARWLREISGGALPLAPGSPLFDGLGRLQGMAAEPAGLAGGAAGTSVVDAEGIWRFLLAAGAPQLRFAGVPLYRRPPPGFPVKGVARAGATPASPIPAQAAREQPPVLPAMAKKGTLALRPVPGAKVAAPAAASEAPAAQPSAARGRPAAVSFSAGTTALRVSAADLEGHPVPSALPVKTAGAPERGGAKAAVVVVELGSYHAPETRAAAGTVRGLADHPNGQVRVIWKDADRGHGDDHSLPERAARAAGEQGEFWAMHDLLLEAPQPVREPLVLKLARRLRLDEEALVAALRSDGLAGDVEVNATQAGELPVLATPSFIVNGRPVDGGWIAAAALQDAVDAELWGLEHGGAASASRPSRVIVPGPNLPGARFDAARLAKGLPVARSPR
jgi:protein-disulfide isomerase